MTDGFCGTKAWRRRRRRRRRRLLVEGERGVDEGFKVDVFESHGRIDSPTTKSWGKYSVAPCGAPPHTTRARVPPSPPLPPFPFLPLPYKSLIPLLLPPPPSSLLSDSPLALSPVHACCNMRLSSWGLQ
ncbi:hypothetical protein B296_00042716 [Ensete ventricosum]|uniref:Uncharacterized protein n=1 Tax=Ensete ventricosum TaxID=4639 RepID=A0A426ZHI5_ENSVE|nr:hypothetical protein B296_00042716 [Ensete ventricosum]